MAKYGARTTIRSEYISQSDALKKRLVIHIQKWTWKSNAKLSWGWTKSGVIGSQGRSFEKCFSQKSCRITKFIKSRTKANVSYTELGTMIISASGGP